MALINKLTAIADAIREVTGSTTPLTLDDMVTEIKKLRVIVAVYGQPVTDRTILSITGGQTVQLGVKLSEEPTQDQTITILSDNDLLTFDKTTMIFTPDNWNVFQYVGVTAGEVEVDTTASITLRNSDELLTDTAITVYLTAEAYSVDMTIPTEGQHVCTIDDFTTYYTSVNTGRVTLSGYKAEYTNIVIPSTMEVDGVTYTPRIVGDNTFKDCTVLQYVTVNDDVPAGPIAVNFGDTGDMGSMFKGCTNLIGVRYRNASITSVYNAFYGCTSLKFVDGLELYTGVTAATSAFQGCSSLEYVPDLSVWTACTDAQQMFNSCSVLKKVHGIPPAITSARMLFYMCSSIVRAEIPSAVTDAFYCFAGCTSLKEAYVYAEEITTVTSMFGNCSGVTCYVPEGSTTYENLNTAYGSSTSVTLVYLGGATIPVLSCWGDSTTSTGTDGEAWPTRLQNKIGTSMIVKNMAISGETTTSTSCRQGGNQAKLATSFTIPADTIAVEVSLKGADGKVFNWGNQLSLGAGYNPVTINGVEGTITKTDSSTHWFTRRESGNAVEVAAETDVISLNSLERKNDFVQVIYLGTNAGWDLNPDTLLNQVQSMVDYYGGTNYIIMGAASGVMLKTEDAKTVTFAYEELAAEAFGDHWLNLREYLIANSLTENGLTATEKDTERMAIGLVPWSILLGSNTEGGTDETHYNTHGLQSVCNAVYAKGQALGYWA